MTGAAPRRPPIWWVLLRHEWRLTWRASFDFAGRRAARAARAANTAVRPRRPRGRAFRIAMIAVAAIGLHAVGLATLALPTAWRDTTGTRLAVLAIVAFLATFMLSYTMSRIVTAFHERRDLDLLLAAPIDPMTVLLVRALTVVAATTTTFAIFVYPLVDVGVATGHWWLARWYAVVPLLAMICTALALVLTDAFVRLVGVRRARVGLQVFSALVGASMYFVSQARNFLPAGAKGAMTAWFVRIARVDDAPWPIEALAAIARGDPLAWLAFVAASVALLAIAVRASRRRFVDIAQAPDDTARVVRPPRPVVERRIGTAFGHGLFATLLLKEWRLILRAPQLLSQVLLQLLYLMPLLFLAFRHGAEAPGFLSRWGSAGLAAAIVGIGGTLATSLAWLTVAAEDAPDLLGASPRAPGTIVLAKIVAAIVPPVAIVLGAAVGVATSSVVRGSIVAVFGTLSCASAAILAAASPSNGRRSDFQRRHKGRGVAAIVEMLQFVAWAGAAGAAAGGYVLASAGITVVAIAMPAWRLPAALRRIDADA